MALSTSTNNWVQNTNYWELLRPNKTGDASFMGDSSTAIRWFSVAWDSAAAFIDDLLGYTYLGAAAFGYLPLRRFTPDPHPRWAQAYCVEATVEGIGHERTNGTIATINNATGDVAFDKALVKATYKSLDYDIKEDSEIVSTKLAAQDETLRFVTRTYGVNSEFFTFDGKMLFVSGPTGDSGAKQMTGERPAKQIYRVEKTMTWHQVPARPDDPYNVPTYDAIKACMGKINSAVFDGDPAGTVLFLGVDPQRSRPSLVDGTVYWTISYKFSVMNNGEGVNSYDGTGACTDEDTEDCWAGWNYIFNPYLKGANVADNRFDLITTSGAKAGNRLYGTADFYRLFKISE